MYFHAIPGQNPPNKHKIGILTNFLVHFSSDVSRYAKQTLLTNFLPRYPGFHLIFLIVIYLRQSHWSTPSPRATSSRHLNNSSELDGNIRETVGKFLAYDGET